MQVEFPEFDHEFVQKALARFEPWRLGNDVLYGLCKEHRRHDNPNAIIAKFWLVGRAYAAAVERRKRSRDHAGAFVVGDDFYTRSLVPCIQRSGIDSCSSSRRAKNVCCLALSTLSCSNRAMIARWRSMRARPSVKSR